MKTTDESDKPVNELQKPAPKNKATSFFGALLGIAATVPN